MAQDYEQIFTGPPTDLGTGSAVLLGAIDAQPWQIIRVSFNQIGGTTGIENVRLEATLNAAAIDDVAETDYWTPLITEADLTPTGDVASKTSGTYLLGAKSGDWNDLVVWRRIRATAWSTAGTDCRATVDFAGIRRL